MECAQQSVLMQHIRQLLSASIVFAYYYAVCTNSVSLRVGELRRVLDLATNDTLSVNSDSDMCIDKCFIWYVFVAPLDCWNCKVYCRDV